MSIWRIKSFHTKLFIMFFLLSSIPSSLIGTMAYQRSVDMLNKQAERDLEVILAQLETSIERQINDFDRFSVLPYFMPEIFDYLNKPYMSKDGWGIAEINAQKTMERLMSAYPSINSSIQGLMIYGMNGGVNGYRATQESPINFQIDLRHEAWYQDVVAQNGGFVVTGLQEINQFEGTPFKGIIGSRLLMDDNHKPLAVIAIFISPNFIEKIIKSLQLNNAQVTVLDGDGKILYATEPILANQILRFGSDVKKGVWESTVKDDKRSIVYTGVSLKSDYMSWKIYMGVNKNEMLAGSHTIRNFTIIVVILLAFISISVSWFLARGLAKPISRLMRSMREVERGKFNVPVSVVRDDEIGQLEKSYGKMVNRLDELVNSIEENERQKRHAELYALRARIQPHFLYNTLNSIRMLAILQQSHQIAKLIQSLNKLLHSNMKLETEVVPFADEISLLQDYCKLMDLRYTNVFNVEWQIDPKSLTAACPPMLLQPLVENAIFHAAKGLTRRLNIIIRAQVMDKGSSMLIQVIDDGGCFPEHILHRFNNDIAAEPSDSIGLHNVRDRIHLRFGEQYGLSIVATETQTEMQVKIPYRLLEERNYTYVELNDR